jgi:hypothetical protein
VQGFQQKSQEFFGILLVAALRPLAMHTIAAKTYSHVRKLRVSSDCVVNVFRNERIAKLVKLGFFEPESQLLCRLCGVNNFKFSHKENPVLSECGRLGRAGLHGIENRGLPLKAVRRPPANLIQQVVEWRAMDENLKNLDELANFRPSWMRTEFM